MSEDAKAQCEMLLNATLPFAERMLAEFGEFIPFGAKLSPEGEIISVSGHTGEEHPRSQDVIDLLRSAFVEEADAGDIIATAIAYDVRVPPPGRSEPADAVAIALDHRDSYSVEVFFPYTIDGGHATFNAAFAFAGKTKVFRS